MAQNWYYNLLGKTVEVTCSCTKCDYKNCSAKGCVQSCSCEDCSEYKTCLLHMKWHSVGCGSDPAIKAAIKLQSPGYVMELPKYSCEYHGSKKNKTTTGCMSEAPKKSNDYQSYKYSKRNEKETPINVYYELAQKPQKQKNQCCHDSGGGAAKPIHMTSSGYVMDVPKSTCGCPNSDTSVKEKPKKNECCEDLEKYKNKAPAYVLEPPKPQKQTESIFASTKPVEGYVLELPTTSCLSFECDHSEKCYDDAAKLVLDLRNPSSTHSMCIKCNKEKPTPQKTSHDCCRASGKQKPVKPAKPTDGGYVLDLPTTSCISFECATSEKCYEDVAKYVLNLRNTSSTHTACSKCAKEKSTTHKTSDKSCHDSSKTKLEAPSMVTQSKCSLCKLDELQKKAKSPTSCCPEYPPTLNELLKMSTSMLSRIYETCKQSGMSAKTQAQAQGQKQTQSSGVCSCVSDTPPKGCGSKTKTKPLGPSSKAAKPCCTPDMYGIMTDTQKQQEHAVDKLKSSYLPQGSSTSGMKCVISKCKCKQHKQTDKPKETKSCVVCKNLKETSKVDKKCTCKKGNADRSESQERKLCQKQNVIETHRSDYLPSCTEFKNDKEKESKKCTCKHNKAKESNKSIGSCGNTQIYSSTNDTLHNAYCGPLRDKQGSLDRLHCIAKENQIELQYFPYTRHNICNSEKATLTTPSLSLTISFTNIGHGNHTPECNTMTDSSKTSSSSKTVQGSDRNSQLLNINRFETRFASDEMQIFHNTSKSECNVLRNKYESPEYSVKSQQYTPTKNAQELFKNIFQTRGNDIDSLINRYQKKSGEFNSYKKHIESESNINELPESSLTSMTQSHEAAKQDLESSGCLANLQTNRNSSHEPVRITKQYSINRLETNGLISSSSKESTIQKSLKTNEDIHDICGIDGYVFELPKYALKNSTTQKSSCKCHDTAKHKSESSGYVLELPKHDKHHKKKCHCHDSTKNEYDKQHQRRHREASIIEESSSYTSLCDMI